jgi:WD40 repeat protein
MTFLTGTMSWDKVKFSEDDVKLVNCWKAHTDAINCVTWVPDLNLVGTCSYDCNVYLWAAESPEYGKGVKMGSLVLGNKATAPGAELDHETRKYRKGWKVNVDKVTRYNEEINEAENIWGEVSHMDYKEMKAKALEKTRKKEGISAQERAQAHQKQLE